VLLPLSFATITGGTLTLIGTSTNPLASIHLLLTSRWLPGRGPADGVNLNLADLSREGYLKEVLLPPIALR